MCVEVWVGNMNGHVVQLICDPSLKVWRTEVKGMLKGEGTCQQYAAQLRHPWGSSPPLCASPPSWSQA